MSNYFLSPKNDNKYPTESSDWRCNVNSSVLCSGPTKKTTVVAKLSPKTPPSDASVYDSKRLTNLHNKNSDFHWERVRERAKVTHVVRVTLWHSSRIDRFEFISFHANEEFNIRAPFQNFHNDLIII